MTAEVVSPERIVLVDTAWEAACNSRPLTELAETFS